MSYDDNIKLEDTKKPSSKVSYDDNNGDIDDDIIIVYIIMNFLILDLEQELP